MEADASNPRVEGALGKLCQIVERLVKRELMIGDFYINASSSDPDRMNIEIKIIRGEDAKDPDYEVPVQYAKPATEAEIARLREEIRKAEREQREKRDRQLGIARGAPPSPRRIRDGLPDWERVPVKPAKPPRPTLTDGARDLDLE